MKKALLIVAFLLILVAIPATVFLVKQRQEIRQRAVAATTLYFQPSTATHNVGDTFSLDVMMETGQNQVAAAQLQINYSNLYLEAQTLTAGDFLPNVLTASDIQAGTATITLGTSTNNPSVSGTGRVATITFRALAPSNGTTAVSFGANTLVSAQDDLNRNVLLSQEAAQITIGGAGGASPQPSPSASPGASVSPGPSATPGVSPSVLPSATAGTGGGATPVPSATPTTTTRITSPTNGATVTTRRPTINGVSFVNGLIILSINTSPQTTSTFYANSSGNWTYTPTSDLANGTYTITVTGNPTGSGNPETVTSTMTVSAGGTGGTTTATPSPSASTTTGASTSSTTSATPLPVTGTATPTLFLFGTAALLVIFGSIALLL